jgi:hypothetical protein
MNHLDTKDFSRRRNDGHEFFIRRVVAAVAETPFSNRSSQRRGEDFHHRGTEGEEI